MDGAVRMSPLPGQANLCATVVSIEKKLLDPNNPYGALEDCALTLKGQALDVMTEDNDEREQPSTRPEKVEIRWGTYQGRIEIMFDDASVERGNLSLVFTYIYKIGGTWGYLGNGLAIQSFSPKTPQSPAEFVRVGAIHDSFVSVEMFRDLKEKECRIKGCAYCTLSCYHGSIRISIVSHINTRPPLHPQHLQCLAARLA